MGFTAKLADLFIQMSAKGVEEVNKTIDTIQNRIDTFEKVCTRAGDTMKSKFLISSQLVANSLAGALQPVANKLTDQLIKKAAAWQGLTAKQTENLRALVNSAAGMETLTKRLDSLRAGLSEFARVSAITIGAATASILGFVYAGVRMSAVGDMIDLRLKQISLAIAGLFRPEIMKVVEFLERTVRWFYSLNEEQRTNIVRWIMGAIVAGALAAILPTVVSGIIASVTAVHSLTLAMIGLETASLANIGVLTTLVAITSALAVFTDSAVLKWLAVGGVFLWVVSIIPRLVTAIMSIVNAVRAFIASGIIAALVAGDLSVLGRVAVGLAVAGATVAALSALQSKVSSDLFGGKGGRGPMAMSMTGFESIEGAYKRIAAESIKIGAGKSVEEKQLEKLDMIEKNTDATKKAVQNVKPAVA